MPRECSQLDKLSSLHMHHVNAGLVRQAHDGHLGTSHLGCLSRCCKYSDSRWSLLLQLITEVDKDDLAKLRDAVDKIQEPIFQYDKTYVYECMEWVDPASPTAAPGER